MLRLFVLCALLLAGGSAAAQAVTVIKFSHVADVDTPRGRAALRFKDLVEQASRGRVRVDVYPNGVLYPESDELEALQLGAVQMLAPSLAKLALSGFREFELFDLPYLFADRQAVARVTQGAVGRSLLDRLESKGMVGLAYWDGGFKIVSSDRPVLMPNDFAGQRMRIHPSRVLDMQMRALGAIPQAMQAADVRAALENGLLDGTETTPAGFVARCWYERQHNVTVSNHGYVGYAVIVNKRFWDRLPAALRKIVERAMAEATTYADALTEQENRAALAWLARAGRVDVHVPSAAETAAWRRALLPVGADLASRIGKAVVIAATGEAEGRWQREGEMPLPRRR